MTAGVFLSDLDILDLTGQNSSSDRPWIELLSNFGYQPAGNSAFAIWVPKGFRCDVASIPRAAWLLAPSWGPWNRAAVIHDWLYTVQPCSRLQADRIFREALAACGVSSWRSVVMFNAVRLGGGSHWENRNPEEIQQARELASYNGGTTKVYP